MRMSKELYQYKFVARAMHKIIFFLNKTFVYISIRLRHKQIDLTL